MTAIRLSLLAAVSALLLAGCSEEEKTAQAEPPAAEARAPSPEPADEPAGDGLEKLRQGAEDLLQGGRELSQDAIDRANEALKDAEPALREAGKAAKEVGSAIEDIVKRAASDLEKAVAELERRIDQAGDKEQSVPGDADAVLAPADQLNADTRAAARAVAAGVGPDYVGVWAATAAECSRIDQEAVEQFAVITPTTIRRYENFCNFGGEPLNDGAVTVTASCIAEGSTEEREIALALPDRGTLQIGTPDNPAAAELMRCHLPGQQ